MTKQEVKKLWAASTRFLEEIANGRCYNKGRWCGGGIKISKEDYKELEPFIRANRKVIYKVGEVELVEEGPVCGGVEFYDDYVLVSCMGRRETEMYVSISKMVDLASIFRCKRNRYYADCEDRNGGVGEN